MIDTLTAGWTRQQMAARAAAELTDEVDEGLFTAGGAL